MDDNELLAGHVEKISSRTCDARDIGASVEIHGTNTAVGESARAYP
jgi:hypothetical protein